MTYNQFTCFCDIDFGWGSQSQLKLVKGFKAELVSIFLHTFLLVMLKFGMILKQFKFNQFRVKFL